MLNAVLLNSRFPPHLPGKDWIFIQFTECLIDWFHNQHILKSQYWCQEYLAKTCAVQGTEAHQNRPANHKRSASSGKEARHPTAHTRVLLKWAILTQFERFLCNSCNVSPLAFSSTPLEWKGCCSDNQHYITW